MLKWFLNNQFKVGNQKSIKVSNIRFPEYLSKNTENLKGQDEWDHVKTDYNAILLLLELV